MQLKEQQYVLTIAKCRSITKAATNLHISQPALSTFLSKLEQQMGVALFDRSDRVLTITSAGKLYLDTAQKMIKLQQNFDFSLSQLVDRYPTRLRVGLQSLRAPRLMPKLLLALNKRFPCMEVHFEDGVGERLQEMLENGEVDIILCNNGLVGEGYTSTTLRNDSLLLVTSVSHPLCCFPGETDDPYETVDLHTLKKERFILLPRTHTLRHTIDLLLNQIGLVLPSYQEVSRQEAALHLTSMGRGIAFTLNSYLPLFDLPAPILCYHIMQIKKPVTYNAIYQTGHFSPEFCSCLLDELGKICNKPY